MAMHIINVTNYATILHGSGDTSKQVVLNVLYENQARYKHAIRYDLY